MDRKKILVYINETIKSENGNEVQEENILPDSNMDSFGYAIFWLSIEQKYGKCFTHDEISKIDYKTLTVKAIIDRIIDAQNNIA